MIVKLSITTDDYGTCNYECDLDDTSQANYRQMEDVYLACA